MDQFLSITLAQNVLDSFDVAQMTEGRSAGQFDVFVERQILIDLHTQALTASGG